MRKKILSAAVILSLILTLAACGTGDKTPDETSVTTKPASFTGNWPRESIMAELPVLVDNAASISHEVDQPSEGNEYYIIYVKEISYQKYYDYIYDLEAMGFNYPDLNMIPATENQTEGKKIEWTADNGELWITCTWNSPKYVNPSSGEAEENQLMLVVRNFIGTAPTATEAN
ncbi:MAG: hypothetical protein K5756_04670 [Clostridiales bacterium]|nr:hypothetical protein [Clostridiales bacterium]